MGCILNEKIGSQQQEELPAVLAARIEAYPEKEGLSPEEFETWHKTASEAGVSGMTTAEMMAMTRGEE